MSDISYYRNKLEQIKGKREKTQQLYDEAIKEATNVRKQINNAKDALVIIQKVAQDTQTNLVYNVETLVSTALSAVYDEPYQFKIDFNIKRGKTEAEIYFVKDGKKHDPLESSGYGAVDVASLALRVVAWSLNKTKHNTIFILDEPFKHVSQDLQEKAMLMLHELSHKLDLQFIVITHSNDKDVMQYSDKIFKVSKSGLYSNVEVIKEYVNTV